MKRRKTPSRSSASPRGRRRSGASSGRGSGAAEAPQRAARKRARKEPPLTRSETKEITAQAEGHPARTPIPAGAQPAAPSRAVPVLHAPLTRAEERERMEAIHQSPTYLRAYEDIAFLKTQELRPVRLQLELLKAELILAKQNVRSTIVVFGGTRIASPTEARDRVEALERRRASERGKRRGGALLERDLRIARRILAKSKYYDQACAFGRIVSTSSGQAEYVITTGGGPGVMEAANMGAYEVGAKSIGMNITLPLEQHPNPYITPELCFQFHYFAIRKMHLLLRAKALVAFPGGYGTFDELFETLTLVQTMKVERLPVLLFGREFWESAVNFQYLVDEGVIDPQDIDLFSFVETAEEAWKKILDFYEAERGRAER